MPKVLVLFEFPTINGGENSWFATVDYLRDVGWEIVAAAPPDGPLADLLQQHQLEHLPFVLSTPTGVTQPLADRRATLAELVRRCRPDLIHANSLNMARLAGPVARQLWVPSVGHVRDIVKMSKQAVTDLNQNPRLICVSQATRQWHIAQGLQAARTVVVYNGVDVDLFRPGPRTGYLHDELRLERNVRIIGSVGQLVVRKGWDLLLDAAEVLIEQLSVTAIPGVHFVIAGQCYSRKREAESYHRELRRRAQVPPLAGHVSFVGRREDVARMMSEFSLLAHPSRQEPFGRVLLEAAACGVPIVATDVGGTREMFAEYPHAAKIVPADGTALAMALRDALDDATWMNQAGHHVRQCAVAKYHRLAAAAGLAQQYMEVLAE